MQWESLLLRVGPILAFLVCVTIVAELADGLGVFSTLAQGAARLAQGSVLGLWLLIVGVAVTATAVLSLDTTAVLVTPVVLALARQLDLDVALFAYTAVWLANTASLFLPVSNLTNLLALSALPRHSVRDFAVLTWPAAVTSVLITVLALAVTFRRSLRGRYQRLPAQPAAHRGLLVLGMIVCGALGPALLLGVNVVAASAVAAAILVVGCAIGARSLLTWRLLPWQLVLGVGLLFILVQIAHDHGLGAALGGSRSANGAIASAGRLGWTERTSMVAVPESVERLQQRPWIAHLIRTVERYLNRLGSQFAAATAYFSVLAIVPVLMVAFSVTGLVLTVLQPGLLDNVANAVADALGSAEPATRQKILDLVNTALSQFWTIGLIGLVVALYTGAKWMGHLKNAVRTQWRPGFDLRPQKINIVRKTLGNLVLLLGLLIGMAVMFGLSSLSTSLANTVVGWLGLSDQPWIAPLLRVTSIVVSIGAGWLIFMYLYTVLPETREPWSVVRRGALLGSIALVVLQFIASYLISAFRGNVAAVIFGPVIVVMLFFNLFAQLVLFIAAWIATADHEAVPVPAEDEPVTAPASDAAEDLEEPPNVIPEEVAVRSVRVGMRAGYVTGAATGVGLGAALAYVLSAALRGRKKPKSD